jgi:hypothetical protein
MRSTTSPLAASTRRIAALVLAVAVTQAALALLFAWPAGRSAMHHVPIAVAGPAAVAQAGARSLEAHPRGAMSVTLLPDLAAARAAVRERRVYGAVVIEDQGLRLLIASGASPMIAQQIVQAVDTVQAQAQGTSLQIEDLAPNPSRDPRGLVPGTALLAVLLSAVGGGALIFLRLRTTTDRMLGLLGLAVLGGAATELMLHNVLGALTGSILAEGGVLSLVVLSASAATVAFGVLADLAGTALAAVLVIAVGYPISGATSAPEITPAPWDMVGRLLPAGAGSTAIRDVAFFGGAGAAMPLLILAAWSLVGLVVVAGPGLVDVLVRQRLSATSTSV